MSLIENMERNYGDFRISIPRWEIPDQGISALVGPSGSGKTSVVRLLLGIEPCPGLRWNFQGTEVASLPVAGRRMGVVFQDYLLFPHMTARQNIEFAAAARKIPPADVEKKLKEWGELLNLNGFLDRKADRLSGGEQQRTALVRALIGRPRFLFLDEPFSALDSELRQESRKLVKRLVEKESLPTLLISHDPADIEALAGTVFRLQSGRLV